MRKLFIFRTNKNSSIYKNGDSDGFVVLIGILVLYLIYNIIKEGWPISLFFIISFGIYFLLRYLEKKFIIYKQGFKYIALNHFKKTFLCLTISIGIVTFLQLFFKLSDSCNWNIVGSSFENKLEEIYPKLIKFQSILILFIIYAIIILLGILIKSKKIIDTSLKIKSIFYFILNMIFIISSFTFFSATELKLNYEKEWIAKLKNKTSNELTRYYNNRIENFCIQVVNDNKPYILHNVRNNFVKNTYKNINEVDFFKREVFKSLINKPKKEDNSYEIKIKENKIYKDYEYDDEEIKNLDFKKLYEYDIKLEKSNIRYDNFKAIALSLGSELIEKAIPGSPTDFGSELIKGIVSSLYDYFTAKIDIKKSKSPLTFTVQLKKSNDDLNFKEYLLNQKRIYNVVKYNIIWCYNIESEEYKDNYEKLDESLKQNLYEDPTTKSYLYYLEAKNGF